MVSAASPAAVPPPLDAGALLQRAVSVIVGSRDAANRPHVVRALGYRMHDAARPERGLTIFLDGVGAAQVIADVRDNGQVAVVFSQPSTHQSVQFKGAAARIEPLQPGDAERVQAYIRAMTDEICSLGYPGQLVPAMFSHDPERLINLSFVPDQAFEQSPGVLAGQAIGCITTAAAPSA